MVLIINKNFYVSHILYNPKTASPISICVTVPDGTAIFMVTAVRT